MLCGSSFKSWFLFFFYTFFWQVCCRPLWSECLSRGFSLDSVSFSEACVDWYRLVVVAAWNYQLPHPRHPCSTHGHNMVFRMCVCVCVCVCVRNIKKTLLENPFECLLLHVLLLYACPAVMGIWKASSLSGIATISLIIQAFPSQIQTHLQCGVEELCLERISLTRQIGNPCHIYLIFSPVNSSPCGGVKCSVWLSHLMEVVLNVFQNRSTHKFHVYFNHKIVPESSINNLHLSPI